MAAAEVTRRRDDATGATRILICDDAPDHRALVRAVLAEVPGVEIVGEAADGDTCLTAIALTDPDVLVLDLHMPRSDGYKVLASLSDLLTAPRVLVLSSTRDDGARARVTAAGAEFLPKGASPDELAAAVRRLAAD